MALLAVLITLGAAASELGCSRDTLRRLAVAGEIRTVRVARRVMIPASEVDRIAESGVGKYAGGEKTTTNGDGTEAKPNGAPSRKSRRAVAHG
jgi:excisionase family DNA binding protein